MVLNFRKIHYCLENIEKCRAYYFGGTLCIDMMPYHPNVGLNRNGRGFAYNLTGKERTFTVPPHTKELINQIYQTHKGKHNED